MPPEKYGWSATVPLERSDSPTLGAWNEGRGEVADLDYLHAHPSAAPPPSLFYASKTGMLSRPRAPTPSNVLPAGSDVWTSEGELQSAAITPSSAYIVESPISTLPSPAALPLHPQNSLGRSASEEDSIISDSSYSHFARSPQVPSLPDPSQFPDPYPFRPPHWQHGIATPALSSADSSTASTRSSAYTSSAKSGDYGHVHVALGDDEPSVGVGITTDDVVQLLARDAGSSSAAQGRALSEQSRWSDPYANSVRSRSSSVGNGRSDSLHENGVRALRGTPSFDLGWQTVDERDEAGLASEEETDDYISMDEDDQDQVEGEEEEPTSAMVVAEEGRGIIVCGDDVPIVRLQVKPGTTHLLIGSSSTPNAVPSFLTNTLPHITGTLLALDISANFLVAIPPALGACGNLEELNIASNPLRILPLFLASLTSLRVLIVDSTGIATLPDSLGSLDKLHTLSIRRNKLNSLPSWLCLLPSLETLLVDGNPFQGPWKALMEPLLASTPMTPLYPPSTPIFPPPSASALSSRTDTDVEDDSPWQDQDRELHAALEEEDTITPARAPHLARSVTSPAASATGESTSPRLNRTRTTPNRAYYDKARSVTRSVLVTGSSGSGSPPSSKGTEESELEDREVRRMKSAGELRRNYSTLSPKSSPQRPAHSEYVTSASSSNLLSPESPESKVLPPKRFASLGAGALSPGPSRARLNTDSSFWDSTPAEDDEDDGTTLPPMPRRSAFSRTQSEYPSMEPSSRPVTPHMRPAKEEKEKSSRWGFLKKMSMGKMRPDPPLSARASPVPGIRTTAFGRPPSVRSPGSSPGIPQIDVRISTTGLLLRGQGQTLPAVPPPESLPTVEEPPPEVPEKPFVAALKVPSNNLLVPSPTPRAAKRRSFLPIDMPPMTIPSASSFVPGLTATNSTDDINESGAPDPVPKETLEEVQLREEERAREARTRALRSVMAYLKDMHDLGLSQIPTIPMQGATVEMSPTGIRSRRPTVVEHGRLQSESVVSIASASSRPVSSAQQRSADSMVAPRSGDTTQTNSVLTTGSGGSGEERKYKDDKVKRSRIIREIVETERTYVKGLQELVDIYITPAAAPVNVLTGVSQRQETVVPAAERKIVFGGLEALFIFHKDSFLPALERASAPLLGPPGGSSPTDADGYLSLDTAGKVAQTFVSHAAFMKMYSTYINNFDNSVQRIRTWALDRPGTPSSGQTLSPSSSNAQLVGLGLSMSAVSAPGIQPDTGNNNAATLSSSQRKRIKSYLKRCRMNPRHSQLNLEGYLLLPVQRIPRYRMLLEELVRNSPPIYGYDDLLDRALTEISSLATNMNEGKRESESRRKLVLWQAKIRGKFPSPLVQPHRRLIMDGALRLTRVVRKATVSFEVIDSHGDPSEVQVECLSPELTPRSLIGILCNDLLVLCRDPTNGQDPSSPVDLWAVLRMQTLPQPASIVHGNALRLVDNKAILYFDAPSTSDALTWFRAINLHIPASKA